MATKNKKANTQKVKTPYIKATIDSLTDGSTNLKAYASATIGGAFVIKGIRVYDSKNGLFAKMPARSFTDGNGKTQYRDICYPITKEASENLNEAVVSAYNDEMVQSQDDEEDIEEIDDEGLTPSM